MCELGLLLVHMPDIPDSHGPVIRCQSHQMLMDWIQTDTANLVVLDIVDLCFFLIVPQVSHTDLSIRGSKPYLDTLLLSLYLFNSQLLKDTCHFVLDIKIGDRVFIAQRNRFEFCLVHVKTLHRAVVR